VIKTGTSRLLSRYAKPSSKETGVMLTVVMILVAGVITWDLTHQSFPAGGVDAPVGVAAADGWLVTLDDRGEAALVVVHDLSDLDSEIDVVQPVLDENSTYDIRGDLLLMANTTQLVLVDLNHPEIVQTNFTVDSPSKVSFVSDDRFAVIEDGQIRYWSLDGDDMTGPTAPQGDTVLLFESIEDQIALVFASDTDTIHIGLVDEVGLIAIHVNATANPVEDEILVNAGFNVDIENATITGIALFENKLAATIDVNATTRLLLFDTISGDSQIVSDPKYAAFDPHMGHGILMFSAYQSIDPNNATEKESDREIMIHDLKSNLTKQLTADDLDQWGPMVLKDHYVYQQVDEDGDISVEVQVKEPKLQPYASNVLKFGVILVFALIFINLMQRQYEANSITRHDSEPAS
jgi:hypothetical protein